jgi:hypothetical protein
MSQRNSRRSRRSSVEAIISCHRGSGGGAYRSSRRIALSRIHALCRHRLTRLQQAVNRLNTFVA